MPVPSNERRERSISLRVLNFGIGDVDTKTPMRATDFTVIAALAQMELAIKRERINDSVIKRRTTFTESQIRTTAKLIQTGELATQVA